MQLCCEFVNRNNAIRVLTGVIAGATLVTSALSEVVGVEFELLGAEVT